MSDTAMSAIRPKHNHMTKAELIQALETGVSDTVLVKRKKWHHGYDKRLLIGYLKTPNAKPIQMSVIEAMVARGQLKWVYTFSGNGWQDMWYKEYRYMPREIVKGYGKTE